MRRAPTEPAVARVPVRSRATPCGGQGAPRRLCHSNLAATGRHRSTVPAGRSDIHHSQCRGARSLADDLVLSRGVVLSRAAASLRSIETQPFRLADLSQCSRQRHLSQRRTPETDTRGRTHTRVCRHAGGTSPTRRPTTPRRQRQTGRPAAALSLVDDFCIFVGKRKS